MLEISEVGYEVWLLHGESAAPSGCSGEPACSWRYLNLRFFEPPDGNDYCDMLETFIVAYQINGDELKLRTASSSPLLEAIEEGRLAGSGKTCPLQSQEEPEEYHVVSAAPEAVSAFVIKHFDELFDSFDEAVYTRSRRFPSADPE